MPTFRHALLPNGLTIVAEVDDSAHTAAAGFFVKTGARDEAPALMGVSHFLEHMMFKGTAARSASDVNEQFDDLGADHNAFTSSELTAFHVHTLPERLRPALEVLSDIMRPSLRQADFDEEKGVILEEIAMYEDQPFWVLYEKAMEAYYGGHPLAHRVLGTADTIKSLSRDQMQGYFGQRYSADNTVLALAGRLDFDAVVADATRWCGTWQTTNARRARPVVAAPARTIDVASDKVNRHYELFAIPAPPAEDERRYAAAVLADILGDADGSRLYWSLIETGLAEDAQAQYEGRDGDGVLLVFVVCPPEGAAEVRRIALEQLRALSASLTDDDLLRARSKIATGITLAGERPAGRMRRLGGVWTALGRYESLEDDLRRVDALTVADLRALIEAFPLEPRTIAALHPQG